MTRQQEDTLTADRLWADYARNRDPRTRDAIVHQFERLAYSIANRFAGKGAENEDLVQVAMMGLVKAVDRFDPRTHHRFTTFAAPTILGELKRYFRDNMWSVHVSRGTQELSQQVTKATRQITEQLGRTPTVAELAERLDVTEERINDIQALPKAHRPLSLDGEFENEGERSSVLENFLGKEDRQMTSAADRVSVRQALISLNEPLREVIRLRYLEDLSQRETARRLGLSQMRVSRMERRALGLLRAHFAANNGLSS
jgi:RNA polymerase sigma-B factor